MPIFTKEIPLSLYIHLPWCVQKCPYCDFNSHALKGALPEEAYVKALLADFDAQLPQLENRNLTAIFFGGGTPSLFSGQAIGHILNHIDRALPFKQNLEITLEANPGTVDESRFHDFHVAGVNRLSIGIQSFNPTHLKVLGRIHDNHAALSAVQAAKRAGFTNFNLDLMFALPHQTLAEALADLQTALNTEPTHLSWYQLTLEPNTLFHHSPPPLPSDDATLDIQLAGQAFLAEHGFNPYEVSAYTHTQRCQHNLNYWEFGDYLGIGAGAHSKLTHRSTGEVHRFMRPKHPQTYLSTPAKAPDITLVDEPELIFEFMLNALRLTNGVPLSLFTERTGLCSSILKPTLEKAIALKLLETNPDRLQPTAHGRLFLNELTGLFLPEN